MTIRSRFFQIDAFTTQRFAGNPAAVMLIDAYPADAVLQALAAENNLAETAFLVPDARDYSLRWFTPTVEVPLCGHATLASAAAVLERLEPGREVVAFNTASGCLTVTRSGAGYRMDFPARRCSPTQTPEALAESLGAAPAEVVWDGFNFLAKLATADQVRALEPDLAALGRLDCAGVIVTAEDRRDYDFVSRYFAPAKGIPEDPVTGGAHCALAPFWAERLGRTSFRAFQASRRGGEVVCRVKGDRVELEGACAFYLEGGGDLLTRYAGSCHCGGVKFRIEAEIPELTTCDCSLCVKKQALMIKVSEAALAVTEGEDLLSLYEWNTRVAKHYFCSRCGIYVFHRKRSAPDHFGVNVLCLDDFDPGVVEVRATDGADMTVMEAGARPEWPGPRTVS